jgi:hypothetical protein
MAYSPDGATLLVAPSGPYLMPLDATTGKKQPKVRLNFDASDGLGVVREFAFSPDGHRLAVAMDGGTLMLCDGHTFGETQRLVTNPDSRSQMEEAFMKGGKLPKLIHALAFSADSKWLATAGSDGGIYIWETASGKEVLRLVGHEGEVATVAFSPDGRTIFSHGQDGQGYLWDLGPKRVAGQPPALKELWAHLAGTDASRAYRAVWALAEDPQAVDFLRTKLPAAAQPDKARLAKLIADLDSDKFDEREAATRALADLAELAAPAMEEACKSTASPEQRNRLERLLAALKDGMSPAQIMQARAVQALELAGTTDARKVLKEWAGGVTAARLTQDAQGALARLDKLSMKR